MKSPRLKSNQQQQSGQRQRLKAYVRVRPALPEELESPYWKLGLDVEDVDSNWIQLRKDGEQRRHFSRVFGPYAPQEDVFRAVAVPAVEDALLGQYATVFCYGQTGTGKTFTLSCNTPEMVGIVPRALSQIFDARLAEAERMDTHVSMQYVQIYRDNVQDLWNIDEDDLPLRQDDELGVSVVGAQWISVTTATEAFRLLEAGDENRVTANTRLSSASSRSHAILRIRINRRDKITGVPQTGLLTLVDLAGSERVEKSQVTGDAFKEAVVINRSLTALGHCIQGLVRKENVAAFRDSKLTRLLQHALCGTGRTAVICTVRPDLESVFETSATLAFAERAQEVQTGITAAGYRERAAEIAAELVEDLRANCDIDLTTRMRMRDIERMEQEYLAARAGLLEYEEGVDAIAKELRDELLVTQRELLAEHKADLSKAEGETVRGIDEIRRSHAVTFKRYDERIAFAVAAETRANDKVVAQYDSRLAELLQRLDTSWAALEEAEPDDEPIPDKVARRRAIVQNELEVKRRMRRNCRQSPNSGLRIDEIVAKVPHANLVRETLREQREILLSRYQAHNLRPRTKWKQGDTAMPTHFELMQYAETLHKRKAEIELNAAKDAASSFGSSTADSSASEGTTSSWASSSSTSGSSSLTFFEKPLPWDAGADDEASGIEVVHDQFDVAVREEEDLAKMKENVFRALHGGTPVYVVQPPSDWLAAVLNIPAPSPSVPTVIIKAFLALNRDRTGFLLSPTDDRLGEAREVFFKDCHVTLGQYSPSFAAATDNNPAVQAGTPMPPTSARISPESIAVFFYRSFTITVNSTKATLDIVVDTDADFEAWCSAILFLGFMEPVWGRTLDISTAPRFDELTEGEQLCCAYHHVYPEQYLKFREGLARLDPPPLFITPMKIREMAGVDVLHSFKLMAFLVTNGDVESTKVHCNQYRYFLQQEALAELDREIVKALRVRIINMLRRYRPSPAAVVQQYLREHEGREQEVLDALVEQYGPEPTDVPEVTPDEVLVEDTEENIEKSRRERQIEESEVKRFNKYGFMLDMADKALMQCENIDAFIRTPYASDTLAARLDVLRRSVLAHDDFQRGTAQFIDMDCVTRPWYLEAKNQYRSLLTEVHEFVARSVLEPGADRCLLLLGSEGSGKSALCRFIFQYYLCRLDLESVAANAANSNTIQLLTAASTGSTVIPIVIDVGSSAKPFESLITEGLSKALGVNMEGSVSEGSLEQPLITLDQLALLDLLFIIDGVDEMPVFAADGVDDGESVMVELMRRFGPSVQEDAASRLYGSNHMERFRKAKFLFTCRHLPQSRSDRLNTNVHDFLRAFVAPTTRSGQPRADVERVSVLYITPLSVERQQQFLYRFILVSLRAAAKSRAMAVHTSQHNMTFFQRGFAGVDYFALEMRKVRDWFIYARNPGFLEHLATALPHISQQPDSEDKREHVTLAYVIQTSVEATIRQRMEDLGLDHVPAELRRRDLRQALQLYTFEVTLGLARARRSRVATPWMTRATTAKLGMVALSEDPPAAYFKFIGPFWQVPMFSSGLNPTVVSLRRHPKGYSRMFALVADETFFISRQVQDYFTALLASKQLLANPSDTTMLLNEVPFTRRDVFLRLLYDHVGRDKLFNLVQLAKKAGGAMSIAAANAVSSLCVAGVPLVGMDFTGLSLAEANLRFGLLDQSNLSHTKLTQTALVGAQLSRATLSGASLKGLQLKDWARVKEDDMLMSAVLSGTGKVLVTGGFEGNVTLYDAPTSRQLATIAGHTACVTGVALSSSGRIVVSSSEDGSVRAWEAATGEQRFKFVGHEDSVTCVALSSNDKLVASGSDDHTVIVWSMETGESVGQLIGHKGPVWSVAFAPDNRRLVSASDDGRVVAWSCDKVYRFLATLATFDFAMKVARYSDDGKVIGAGGEDGALYLFDAAGDPHAKLEGHTDCIWAIGFSPSAPLVVSGGSDRTLRVWDHEACVEVAAFNWHWHELRSTAFSRDGSMIITAACDRSAKISAVFLDTVSTVTMETFRPSSINSVCFNADRSVVYSDSYSVTFVDVLSGDFRRRWESREPLTCSFHAPGQHSTRVTMVGSAEFRAIVLQEGPVKQSTRLDAVHMIHDHGESPVVAIHGSADGLRVVTITADCTLRFFTLVSTITKQQHESVEAQIEHEVPLEDLERVNDVCLSRDGETAAVACGDGTIRLIAAVDGAEVMLLEGHRSAVLSVAFSPDQRIVLSGSSDKTVRLWDATAGVEVMSFMGHLAPVTCVALSPKATEAFSGSLDNTLRVWDVLAGQESAAVVTHQVSCVAVSDDAKVVVTGGFDGTVRVMTRVDLNWCVVNQIGSRRHANLIAHQLRGVDEATEKTKAVNYLLESLASVQVAPEKKKKKKKKKKKEDAADEDDAAAGEGGDADQRPEEL